MPTKLRWNERKRLWLTMMGRAKRMGRGPKDGQREPRNRQDVSIRPIPSLSADAIWNAGSAERFYRRNIMPKYDEPSVMQRAYDELKALDPDGVMRVLDYLRARFEDEHLKAKQAREQAARDRIAKRASETKFPSQE
jgi:hypothetical protein